MATLTAPETVAERQAQGILPVKCAKCGHGFYARKSMMMTEFGINSGSGTCSKCKTYLHLEVSPDLGGFEMVSMTMDDYAATLDTGDDLTQTATAP